MFLSYVTCGQLEAARPVLCIVPDKPDQFSSLIPVASLGETVCAYHRASALETFTVARDEADGGMVLQALTPSKLFITPDLHDKPGVAVALLKILETEKGVVVSYIQEGDPSATWKEWNPNKRRGSTHSGGGAKQ